MKDGQRRFLKFMDTQNLSGYVEKNLTAAVSQGGFGSHPGHEAGSQGICSLLISLQLTRNWTFSSSAYSH